GATLGRGDGGAPAAGAIPTAPTGAAVPVAPGDVARLEGHLGRHPDDAGAWAALGSALVERARVTADPSLYPRAEGAFDRSLTLQPEANLAALMGRGALANARHDFAAGLGWGQRAASLNPNSPEVHAVVGDALVELGRYEEAFEAYQTMVDIAPGLASYTRAAYALDLQGDTVGAQGVLELALADIRAPQRRAFALTALGDQAWATGNLDEARVRYEEAAALDADSVGPTAGLARVAGASGDVDTAVRHWRRVVERAPLPEYVAEFGTLLEAEGRPVEADDQYALLDVQRRLLEASGVNGDLELALSSADRGVGLAVGLEAARAEWARRQSIHAADALAWQLHAHGQNREALGFADRALRLGTKNASFLFHRARIRSALGDATGAQDDFEAAAAANPYFSPRWAPALQDALARP
ncbi:MAG: tetratricopeptide repeat protein, partial [Acidimicrobiia bacterium]